MPKKPIDALRVCLVWGMGPVAVSVGERLQRCSILFFTPAFTMGKDVLGQSLETSRGSFSKAVKPVFSQIPPKMLPLLQIPCGIKGCSTFSNVKLHEDLSIREQNAK